MSEVTSLVVVPELTGIASTLQEFVPRQTTFALSYFAPVNSQWATIGVATITVVRTGCRTVERDEVDTGMGPTFCCLTESEMC